MTGMWEKKAPLPYSWKSKVLQAFLKAIQQHLLELEMHLLFPLLGICSIEQKPSSLTLMYLMIRASTGKESACKAGDMGSISGLGRSPGGGNGNPFQFLAWKIPWTEEPGRLQSQRVVHNLASKPPPQWDDY